ncbi:cation-dependent mannose-6-phosphate receptor-like isoform X1 [Oculina patagonica]
MIMDVFRVVSKAYFLVCLSLCTLFLFSAEAATTREPTSCPQHQGSDPSDVNERVKKLAGQDVYYAEDDDYKYKISICAENKEEDRAVLQHGKKWPDGKWITVGQYKDAHVTGGADWLMIKYFHGEKYSHHCNGLERIGVVLVTCDPGEQRGEIKVIEEYRDETKDGSTNPLECYYLFALNHDAACTESKYQSSPWFIVLIILVVLETLYIILGFIYQRYVAQAKGLEQCGGCNFARCCQRNPQTEDTVTNDDFNNFDNALPVLL